MAKRPPEHPFFRPRPLPPLPSRPVHESSSGVGAAARSNKPKPLDKAPLLFGRPQFPRMGQFKARFFDAQSRWVKNTGSARWRLIFPEDEFGRPQVPFNRKQIQKEFGEWVDLADGANLTGAGSPGAAPCMPISFGDGVYRDLNAQFQQMAGKNQDVKIPFPRLLITDDGNPLGRVEYSTVQNSVGANPGRGFIRTPPASHYMDADPGPGGLANPSATFGKWVEPDEQSIIDPENANGFFRNSSTLDVRLKAGISRLRVWCPSGEYSEFDTGDTQYFKVTRQPTFGSEAVSLPIKSGWDLGTNWDVYLTPRSCRILAHWWDYYIAVTQFTIFEFGLHNVFSHIGRLPSWPVPYGFAVGGAGFEVANPDDVEDDWIYYVARWHGPFAPGIAQAHPRPQNWFGYADPTSGSFAPLNPENIPGGIWEGDPVHQSDWAVEFQVKTQLLLKHNPFDFEVLGNPFFGIFYEGSSPTGYLARLNLQQPESLVAKIVDKGRLGKNTGGTYYVWQKILKLDQIQRTLNVGTMFYDFLDPVSDLWTVRNGLTLAGYVPF